MCNKPVMIDEVAKVMPDNNLVKKLEHNTSTNLMQWN